MTPDFDLSNLEPYQAALWLCLHVDGICDEILAGRAEHPTAANVGVDSTASPRDPQYLRRPARAATSNPSRPRKMPRNRARSARPSMRRGWIDPAAKPAFSVAVRAMHGKLRRALCQNAEPQIRRCPTGQKRPPQERMRYPK